MRLSALRLSIFVAVSAMSIVGSSSLGLKSSANLAFASTSRPCNGNYFVGAWTGVNGAEGTSIFDLAFINEGGVSCRLSGYPTIQGYRSNREYRLSAEHVRDNTFDISPTIVAPRMSGEMVITTSALCDALNTGSRAELQQVVAKNTYTISVKFPHSYHTIYIYGLRIDVACGLEVTQLGWR